MALCPGLPGWAGTRKAKPIWILLKQETVSGNGIRWAICKSAPRSRQITTPAPHSSVFFTGRMPFLPPNQQCQSTEGAREAEPVHPYLHFCPTASIFRCDVYVKLLLLFSNICVVFWIASGLLYCEYLLLILVAWLIVILCMCMSVHG